MRRHRRSLWTNTAFSYAAAVLCGMICAAFTALFLAALIFFVMRDMKLVKSFATASLAFGAYTGAFLHGKYRRRKGIFAGSLCGVLMYAAVSISCFIICGQPTGIKKLLLLAVFGAAGGVAGVNSKRPSSLMDQ